MVYLLTKKEVQKEKGDYTKTFSKGKESKIGHSQPIHNVLPLMNSGMSSDQNKTLESKERPRLPSLSTQVLPSL